MTAGSTDLVLYGQPASQPSRAVCWTLLLKNVDFRLVAVSLKEQGPSGPLARINPTGQVPTIIDGGFVLYEMPAILTYLCEKHGWDDLWPRDQRVRAGVNQYLHFHHNWTRQMMTHVMAPHVVVAFLDRIRKSEHWTWLATLAEAPNKLEAGRAKATSVCKLIEAAYFPDGSAYLCAPHVTIADIACYEELAQLRWANLFDFDAFPKLQGWLDQMAELPFHEVAHKYNTTLGDIRTKANTMERFLQASDAALKSLADHGICVEPFVARHSRFA